MILCSWSNSSTELWVVDLTLMLPIDKSINILLKYLNLFGKLLQTWELWKFKDQPIKSIKSLICRHFISNAQIIFVYSQIFVCYLLVNMWILMFIISIKSLLFPSQFKFQVKDELTQRNICVGEIKHWMIMTVSTPLITIQFGLKIKTIKHCGTRS